MDRRRFLGWTCATAVGVVGTPPVAATSALDPGPPGVAWRRTYNDLAIASVVPAHDGGHVFVGRGENYPRADVPVRVAVVDETGSVRKQREIDPDIPEEARRARADLIRTDDGYAVATGSWFARLGTNLSVRATGFAAEHSPNSTTFLTELPSGFAVAAELDMPNHVSFTVFGFDGDGALQWTQKFGEWNSKWLHYLLDQPDGGLVVGGGFEDPWLANLGPDGTVRWQTTVADAPDGMVSSDTNRGDDGIVLFGGATMVRLTPDPSIDWQRSYDAFRDSHEGQIARTTDGGYLLAAGADFDQIRIGKTDADGRLLWSHKYTVINDGAAILNDIVERSPGEYLVVGAKRDDQQGWALLLSERQTPTLTRTPTLTSTGTPSPLTTDSMPPQSTTDATSTTQPGFGIGAALVGTAAGLLARRR